MKKIINGKVYDTTTAKRCSDVIDIGSVNELEYYGLTLYKKRTGEFFLSRDVYLGDLDNGIIPLTYDDAREWAESHLDADDYESIFGEITENDRGQILSLSISAAAAERARRAAAQHGLSLSEYIEGLIP